MKYQKSTSTKWIYYSSAVGVALLATLVFASPFIGINAGNDTMGNAQSVKYDDMSKAANGDEDYVRALETAIETGTYDQMSSAKQMQLQLMSGMKYEEGVLKPGVPNDVRKYRGNIDFHSIKTFDAPGGILTALANPQVNDPTLDVIGTQKTQSETTVIRGSGTNMIAAYNDSGFFVSGTFNAFTGYSTSSDGGATWTDRGAIAPGAFGHFGDPVLARNNTTGRIYQSTIAATTNGMNVYSSDDNGVTWSVAVNGAPGTLTANGDKEWIAVDNFAGSGQGNVYFVYRDFASGTGGMRFTKSIDNGATFLPNPGTLIASTGQGAYVVVGADHAVYYFWLDSVGGQTLKVRKSTDQGATFAAAVTVNGPLNTTGVNGNLALPAGYRTSAFPSVAVNPTNANILYIVHNDINVAGTDRGDIYFQQSTDGGATWSARLKVNIDSTTNAQDLPSITVRPDGSALAITWYDNRSDPANRKFERFGRIGTISGSTVTFGPDFVASNAQSTPVFGQDSVVNSVYMGDYDSMDSNNTNFFTTFVDTRLGTQDVRFANIPATGPGAVIGFRSSSVTTVSVAANSCTPFDVTLANNGSAAATGVTATLTTAATGVTILNATQNYGAIAAGATAVNPAPYQLSIASSFVCGTKITINVSVSTGESLSFDINTQGLGYQTTTATAQTIVPGTVRVDGVGGDDVVTSGVPIPFPFTFNGTPFSAINVSSNGNAQFTSTNTAFTNTCPLPSAAMNNLLAVYWDDLRTDRLNNGVFTSTTGVTPNRIFNIEYRATTFSSPEAAVGFEIRLYETGGVIEYIYGDVTGNATNANGSSATEGLQKGTGAVPATDVTQFACNTAASIPNGLKITFTPVTTCPQGGGTCGTAVVKSRADFDGDGRTDISVYRPSEGNWYLNRSTAGFGVVKYGGAAGDVLIPGDYDGDGKADFAIWRPANDPNLADFYILNSNGFTISGYSHGLTTDIPVAGDFDGDGKNDIVVFRPSTGIWYLFETTTQTTRAAQFGLTGDIPMAFDNDGDGKANLAVFRPSNNTWYIAKPTGVPAQNFDSVQFGLAGDILVPANYDGDNKVDIAVFRPSNGTWYIRRSTDGGVTYIQFGASGDIPVPGDYDGDGKDDVAVYRAGTWYLNGSTAGFSATAFGLSTDTPIPARYHP